MLRQRLLRSFCLHSGMDPLTESGNHFGIKRPITRDGRSHGLFECFALGFMPCELKPAIFRRTEAGPWSQSLE